LRLMAPDPGYVKDDRVRYV